MMVIATPVLSCLAVLAGLIFVECSVTSPAPSVGPFLAGEDTPVWLADRPHPSQGVVYTRLESGLVKKAILYWNDMKTKDGFPIRKSKSFKMSNAINLVENVGEDNEDMSVIPLTELPETNTTHQEPSFLYPTILLVVDYDYFLPMTSQNEEKTIKERIIYALSFWYSVNFNLQNIKHPNINIRIGGIVITRNRKASPYINNVDYYYSLVNSLAPMLDYWVDLSNVNPDFTSGTYNIVAHMTDSHPYREGGYSMYAGIASTSNPCVIKDGVSGVIVYDDLAFLGLHTAVEKMSNVFGDDSISWKQYTFDWKVWTPTSLAKIQNALKNANCMSAPLEHYPPGKPIQPILAADLLPRAKQCEAHGFNKRTFHCWTTDFWNLVTSTCKYLKCSNSWTSITCTYSNPTLDGTFCSYDNKKICMAGECVLYE